MKRFLLFFLLLFIAHCTLKIEDCKCQWMYQPVGYVGTPYDMKFFDANTGIISTDSQKVLKTTNGGNNWILERILYLVQIEKINDSIMFCMGYRLGNAILFKISKKGQQWDSIYFPSYINFATYQSVSFVNKDTGWICGFDGSIFHVWRTTDGGISFQSKTSAFGFGPIFFLNYKINGEYYGWCSDNTSMYKTTNSGVNWFNLGLSLNWNATIMQISMLNENIGWTSIGDTIIYKTTNGGVNWFTQYMPSGHIFLWNQIGNFKIINQNIIYGIAGARWFGPSNSRGIIWKTTNGGINWGYQQPDTVIHNQEYHSIDFIDSLNGWCENIHTTNGGGQIIYVGISNNETAVKDFELSQNYPNPFNNSSKIKYQVPLSKGGSGVVILKIFDILGKEIETLIDEKQKTGIYEVSWNGTNYPSGIYFYRLTTDEFSDTKKMLLIK